MNDALYMHRCLELAGLGAGRVAPNPMVGAVLVYQQKIIGEGYHEYYGKAHAEVNCLEDAAKRLSATGISQPGIDEIVESSTLYVSLEPCAHFGKTPPCADLIISRKIPRVIVGCRDPFGEVDGKGIAKLRGAGVEVITGVLEDDATDLNKRFFAFHTKRRPYIILKWAQSADSMIASGNAERILISNEVSNRKVHKWRSEEASILVGTATARKDDPLLTTRLWGGPNPLRAVIDMHLSLPLSLRIFNDEARTIIFNLSRHEEINNLVYYKVSNTLPLPAEISRALYLLNIQSVLIEGGTKTIQAFIDSNMWDEARVITNNQLRITNGVRAPQLPEVLETSGEAIHSDTIRYFKPLSATGM